MRDLIGRVDIKVELEDIRQDIDALYEVEVMHEGYLLRSPLQGVCGKVLRAVGVTALPL